MMRHNKRVIGAIGIIILVFAVLIGILFASGVFRGEVKSEPRQAPQTEVTGEVSSDQPSEETAGSPKQEPEETTEPEVDPATLGTIDIEPAGLTVSYVKGVGGFQYEVKRASQGRKYLELSNESLIGTKCSNDTGVFVSIVESPNDSEKGSVAKTVVVEGTTYGLSVASPTCTSKP